MQSKQFPAVATFWSQRRESLTFRAASRCCFLNARRRIWSPKSSSHAWAILSRRMDFDFEKLARSGIVAVRARLFGLREQRCKSCITCTSYAQLHLSGGRCQFVKRVSSISSVRHLRTLPLRSLYAPVSKGNLAFLERRNLDLHSRLRSF